MMWRRRISSGSSSGSGRRHNIRLEMIFDMIKFLHDLFRVCPCFLELYYEFLVSLSVSFSVFAIRKKDKEREREKRTYGQYQWVFQIPNQSVYSTTYTRDTREDTEVQVVLLFRVQR